MACSAPDGVVDNRLFSTKKISVFLDDNTYLLWRQQVLLALKAHKLQGFLDLQQVPPAQLIADGNGGFHANPEFERFEQQDSALASWLLSSISQAVLPHLIGMDTSAKIWNAIVTLYGSKTTSKLMFYRRSLHSQRKGDVSMKDFLMNVKSCCDNLASCGEVISDHEHVTVILNGLPSEYESIISIITASQVPYTVQEVTSMLLDAETRQQVVNCEIFSSANMVSHQSSEASNNTGSIPAYRPSSSNRGRGRGRSANSRIQCQLCGRAGHLVDRCYYRFDSSYKSNNYRPPPQANFCMVSSAPTTVPWSPPAQQNVQWCPPGWCFSATPTSIWPNSFVGSPSQQVNMPTSGITQPQAYVATPETVADNSWYPNSGATHHLTNSATTISDGESYKGPGKVFVGNGSTLPVLTTGQSSLLTRSRPLFMRSLLFVPGITKNLLFVSKFAKDNRVMFEFFPTQCQLRDLQTKEVLLKGSVHHGLYRLHLNKSSAGGLSSTCAQCLTASKMLPLNIWHSRLGHLCQAILSKALLRCNIQFADNNKAVECVACHLGKEHKLSFSKSNTTYSSPLQLIVADIWGPAPLMSNGFRYYAAFTDAYSRYTWLYFLKKKSELVTVFPQFHRQAERVLGAKLQMLQTDGGGEFQALKSYLTQHGIVQRLSCPYTSAQNGLVERKHRQVVETGLSMLAHAAMPLKFWNEAFCSAVFLINRLPSHPLGDISPYEKLF